MKLAWFINIPGASRLAPADLRIASRVVLHALLVGAVAGLVGAGFFGLLEVAQHFILEMAVGVTLFKAHGEELFTEHGHGFVWWLVILVPALGGLVCGLLTRYVPQARGGGADVAIEAFHHRGGKVAKRVGIVKALASLATLGTGGAGGREGPTMLIGSVVGSMVARWLKLSQRERRVLLLAGVAAGVSAVFRTPLGAALLAVEILYRDGFEADALVPCVLASVVGYSVVITLYGESTLFTVTDRFPFRPSDLPLYALLAVIVAGVAGAFVTALHRAHAFFDRVAITWLRPALGGLATGLLACAVLALTANKVENGLSVMTGGYGLAQLAISGASWLGPGWGACGTLGLLCVAKLLATSFTVGSGGSAGDFAPSIVLGGLTGAMFGRAAQLVLGDPTLNPAGFALVGMGAFYGGAAHVPLAALVLVCEMAHSYDLLVPLMVAEAIALILLRKRTLYPAQLGSFIESPAHRDALVFDLLRAVRVDGLKLKRPVTFRPYTSAQAMLDASAEAGEAEIFPVTDEAGNISGIVVSHALRLLAVERDALSVTVAADIADPGIAVTLHDDLRRATEIMADRGVHEVPVVDASGKLVGILDEGEITRVYAAALRRVEEESQAL